MIENELVDIWLNMWYNLSSYFKVKYSQTTKTSYVVFMRCAGNFDFLVQSFSALFCYENMNLSIGNEYEIPADEFEAIIKQHYKISSEVLHMLLRYDSDKNVYIYRPRGFDEFDYAEVPYPEVVGYEENEGGSITLLVNAVYPNSNTSKLFSHEVTVLEEDGRIYYLANKIIGDEELDLWWHADRLTDGESYEKKEVENNHGADFDNRR